MNQGKVYCTNCEEWEVATNFEFGKNFISMNCKKCGAIYIYKLERMC